MKKVCVFVLLLALCGCQTTPKVVDNTYYSTAGDELPVPNSFEYFGIDEDPFTRTENGGMISSRCDYFLRHEDGVVRELLVFNKLRISRGYQFIWNGSPNYEFMGKEYNSSDGDFVDNDALHEDYLKLNKYLDTIGLKLRDVEYYGLLLSRPSGISGRIAVWYIVDKSLLVNSIADNGESIRERFENLFKQDI